MEKVISVRKVSLDDLDSYCRWDLKCQSDKKSPAKLTWRGMIEWKQK
jgi:hypothetical protein